MTTKLQLRFLFYYIQALCILFRSYVQNIIPLGYGCFIWYKYYSKRKNKFKLDYLE